MYTAGLEGGQHFRAKLVDGKELIKFHLTLNLQYQTHLNICCLVKLNIYCVVKQSQSSESMHLSPH